jgi:transposase
LDESGFLMAPLVRRTWAPVGQTPILRQRGRFHQRVSMVGAILVSPRRHRVRLVVALFPNANVDTVRLLPFVRQLRRLVRTPLILVWDRLNVHRSVARQLCRPRGPIRSELLPPYAPELNPVELLWSWMKRNPLANDAVFTIEILAERATLAAQRAGSDPVLLKSFIRATPLASCLK